MLKAIFHVDELEKWELVLENTRNFITAKPDAVIEVLANSKAVTLFDKSHELPTLLKELADKKVTFAVCRNALNKFGIPEAELPPILTVVPAGVVELAEKQAGGYAYIRP